MHGVCSVCRADDPPVCRGDGICTREVPRPAGRGTLCLQEALFYDDLLYQVDELGQADGSTLRAVSQAQVDLL